MPEELEARVEALERRVAALEGGAGADEAQRILGVVAAEVFGVRGGYDELRTLTMESHAAWDSLKQVEFLVALEQHSGVRFDSSDLTRLTSVDAAYKLLRAKL